jgi:octaprenyl-diphosphate synthase
MAFQIRDDIFDYMPQLNTGKPAGGDILEKKITLPLIYALKASTDVEKESFMKLLRESDIEGDLLVSRANYLISRHSGIEKSQDALMEQCRKAEESLDGLKESIYKRDLVRLARYVGNRVT